MGSCGAIIMAEPRMKWFSSAKAPHPIIIIMSIAFGGWECKERIPRVWYPVSMRLRRGKGTITAFCASRFVRGKASI